MELSIQLNGAAPQLAPSAPSAQAPPAPSGTGAITAIQVASSTAAQAALEDSWIARYKLGDDTREIAIALKQTMQKIVDQRPDLANTAFDFVAKNGSLQVVSTELSPQDRNWVATQLNANTALVDNVKTFNDDATTVYSVPADASPTSIAAAASKASDQVNGGVKFMSLLNSLGTDIQDTMNESGGKYSRTDGGALDLSRAPNSAARFLSFFDQMQAVQDGAMTFTAPNGKMSRNAFWMANPYSDAGFNLPDLPPGSASGSVGLSVKA
jgi:hypothetical protein